MNESHVSYRVCCSEFSEKASLKPVGDLIGFICGDMYGDVIEPNLGEVTGWYIGTPTGGGDRTDPVELCVALRGDASLYDCDCEPRPRGDNGSD